MNILYTIFFVIFIIRLIAYFLKNSKNPNRNNTIVKEYKFSEKLQKFEKVELIKKSEREELKEFAKHHFEELKKINPLANLNDDFPEALFPKAFKKLLLTDNITDEDYTEAVKSINTNFTRPVTEEYKKERISVLGNDIYINNDLQLRSLEFEIQPIFKLEKKIPEIRIFEDCTLIKTFILEPRDINPNLEGQYFHSSIRINLNSSIQIDGYISKNPYNFQSTDEGVRFQPFYLSDKENLNIEMKGKGMFERGLHYSGYISSGNMRLICNCDDCKQSFSVEFYHAGFSEIQYFYSSNSKETLIVPYSNNFGKVPFQLQKEIDEIELKELENKLPKTEDGKFEYYNSFKCPHCYSDYINFRENKEIRPNEYYVNYYINQKPRYK
jgi:hypothetical protein